MAEPAPRTPFTSTLRLLLAAAVATTAALVIMVFDLLTLTEVDPIITGTVRGGAILLWSIWFMSWHAARLTAQLQHHREVATYAEGFVDGVAGSISPERAAWLRQGR